MSLNSVLTYSLLKNIYNLNWNFKNFLWLMQYQRGIILIIMVRTQKLFTNFLRTPSIYFQTGRIWVNHSAFYVGATRDPESFRMDSRPLISAPGQNVSFSPSLFLFAPIELKEKERLCPAFWPAFINYGAAKQYTFIVSWLIVVLFLWTWGHMNDRKYTGSRDSLISTSNNWFCFIHR